MTPFWGKVFCACVLVASAFLFLFQLNARPFWDYDEAIFAQVNRETVQSENPLILTYLGKPFFEKPPLYFWLSMATDRIFNQPELSYRLPAALFGILSIALVMLITLTITGSLFASGLAGLALLTIGPFIDEGRQVRLDVPAIAMILLGVYSFLKGLKKPMWFLGIGVSLALGFLFKSVVGLLGVLFILIWSLFYRDFRWLKNRYFWAGLALGGGLLGLWFGYETYYFGATFWNTHFAWYIFGLAVGGVVTTELTGFAYVRYVFYYLAPWSWVFVAAFVWTSIKYKQVSERHAPIIIFGLTSLAILALFTIASAKYYRYLLPSYPFIAITVALAIYAFLQEKRSRLRISLVALLFATASVNTYLYSSHAYSMLLVNDLITKEEADIGLFLARPENTDEIYTYQHDYWDTIRYYSGGRMIRGIELDQILDKPFFLVMPRPLFYKHSPFPPELDAHFTSLYGGEIVVLLHFTP